MDANASQLQDHTLVEVQLVDLEEGRAGSLATADEHVVSEPTVGTVALVGTSLVTDQAENALIGAQVGAAGGHAAVVAVAAGDNGGNDLIAHTDGVAGGVLDDVLTAVDHLAGALVAENHGHKAEGIHLPLVYVGTADACALDLDEDVVLAQLRQGNFLDLDLLGADQHSHLGNLGQITCGLGCGGVHGTQHGADNGFNLISGNIHCFSFLS